MGELEVEAPGGDDESGSLVGVGGHDDVTDPCGVRLSAEVTDMLEMDVPRVVPRREDIC